MDGLSTFIAISFGILSQSTVTTTVTLPGNTDPKSFQLPEWFFDAGWWQVILAVIAIIVTLAICIAQWNRKRLVWKVISNNSVMNGSEIAGLNGRLQITFDNKPLPVLDIHSIVIKVANAGNSPIDSHDWRSPLNFDFGDEAEVLMSEVIEPKKYSSLAKPSGTKVELQPVLLNRRNHLLLKILVRQPSTITIDAAIMGVDVT